ncbi:adenosylmethionine decarboxylase [Lacimonas salitolerans]|uniref:Adenosylmethionine decarboxylase n=1 Tax=Lacimonas salitolerans TaxID=1323750 RepID=A0ABW4EIL3_9RHOB
MTAIQTAPIATETFGVHLMLDIYDAEPARLADSDGLDRLLTDLIAALRMHPIHETVVVEVGPKNRKDPGGLSAFVMIAESHISIHTFPRRRFASMDIYTCQSDIDSTLALTMISSGFGSANIDCFRQPRGIRYPARDVA